jgi:hypothetical protein
MASNDSTWEEKFQYTLISRSRARDFAHTGLHSMIKKDKIGVLTGTWDFWKRHIKIDIHMLLSRRIDQ